MKIRLSDGTELEAQVPNVREVYYLNTTRKSIDFLFKKQRYPLDQLDQLFSSSVLTAKITIIDTNTGVEVVYDNYQLKTGLRLEPQIISPETPESPVIVEEVVIVTMAQLTYIEKQLQRLGVVV